MRAPWSVVALLSVSVLAGCVGGDDAEEIPTSHGASPSITGAIFHSPTATIDGVPDGFADFPVAARPLDVRVVEPTMGVTPDGSIFVVAGTDVLKSDDKGRTWTSVGAALPTGHSIPPTTLDPMLHVDPITGRLFVNHLYVACSFLSMSDDEGGLWLHQPFTCGTLVNDHQSIVTGPYPAALSALPVRPYENVVYYAYNGLGYSGVSSSFDGGITWTPARIAYAPDNPTDEEENTCGGLHGHLTTDLEGRVFLPREECGRATVAVSEDAGLTWTLHNVDQGTGYSESRDDPSVAVDLAGNVYYIWPGADLRMYLAISRDHGATWSEPVVLSPPDVTATVFATTTAGSEGRFAWSFIGTRDDTADWERLHSGFTDEVVNWTLFTGITINALDDEPLFATFEIGNDTDPIQRGGISNLGSNEFSERNLLDFYDMGVDAEGRIYVSYGDGCTKECAVVGAGYEESTGSAGNLAVLVRGPGLFAQKPLAADV